MYIAITIIAAFLITFILIPVIIKISRSVKLLDTPDRRKIHSIETPTLGGIGIYIGIMVACLMVLPFEELAQAKYFFFGIGVIFILGIRDDVSSLSAKNKLFTQMFAATLVVLFSDIKLTGFYGIFGISDMPEIIHIPLSIFIIVALTNSFNLIDGIDGLAGSVSVLILSVLSYMFFDMGDTSYAFICLATIGAVGAFLVYNWHPSKIFMGDTGSLILGFMLTCMVIHFIKSGFGVQALGHPVKSTVALGIALMIVPIFDTFRVFTIRFINGKNPLDPDRNHLHHNLLKLRLSHSQATTILVLANLFVILEALILDPYLENGALTFVLLITVAVPSFIMDRAVLKRKIHQQEARKKAAKVIPLKKSA